MSDALPVDEIYPVGEKQPHQIETRSGRRLADLSLDALVAGDIGQEEFAITPAALRLQADIARRAGRETLARNFERGAELTAVPTEIVMDVYESLRPGRCKSKAELLEKAAMMRERFGAILTADLIEEAPDVYETRGILRFRF
ncbi:MAG: diol dehydratase small subunit [Dongiaceae bacterium]